MKLKYLVLLVALSGCSVQKAFVPTGGSRADATVELSFEYGGLQVPKWDPTQAEDAANERCRAWGFDGAQAFGGVTRKCNYFSGKSCKSYLATMKFQCLGTGSSK